MAISAAAALRPGLAEALRELSLGHLSGERHRTEVAPPAPSHTVASPTAATVSDLATRTDLAALQLSQLQAMMTSLGRPNPDNFNDTGHHEAIRPAPASSTTDFYA